MEIPTTEFTVDLSAHEMWLFSGLDDERLATYRTLAAGVLHS